VLGVFKRVTAFLLGGALDGAKAASNPSRGREEILRFWAEVQAGLFFKDQNA
jgi:hypothetical protein